MILPHYMTKSLGFKAFHNFFVTNLLSFYKQSYSLNGSDLAYHLVGIPPHSTSPIPWAEHLLLLRYYLARTSSDTASTWCVCGTQKVQWTFWGLTAFYQQTYTLDVIRLWTQKVQWTFLRINCVSLTNSHTLHGAFEEINQPAGLSSIRSPTLDRVWYHAPWLLGYMRRR